MTEPALCIDCDERPVRTIPLPMSEGDEVSWVEALMGSPQYCDECFAGLPDPIGEES